MFVASDPPTDLSLGRDPGQDRQAGETECCLPIRPPQG